MDCINITEVTVITQMVLNIFPVTRLYNYQCYTSDEFGYGNDVKLYFLLWGSRCCKLPFVFLPLKSTTMDGSQMNMPLCSHGMRSHRIMGVVCSLLVLRKTLRNSGFVPFVATGDRTIWNE